MKRNGFSLDIGQTNTEASRSLNIRDFTWCKRTNHTTKNNIYSEFSYLKKIYTFL
jgi:hypothetical protein